ncbi:aromatic-L-amino-acid decarboxylase [Coprinopsis marcescibilis]|uniref:Aromatic-L-amino-acid decarboxylase n=1 Tax=Coprinopsis marcescibilis TaxID=230819 RepID=A0A5C3KT60_COPMA|nr:aromatic-L-amino-acid decarboxylase [Coprinopsis marcescibilis]
MDIEQFRKAGYQAIDNICDYFYSLGDKPLVSPVEPGYLSKLVPSSAPDAGEDFDQISDDFKELILPGITPWQHPSFFAYFPTSCTFEGILGDLYSSSVSNPGFNWSASPACTELEVIVMDWAAKLFGLSPAFYNTSEVGGGVIQTTASDSVLVAVVAARSRYQKAHPNTRIEELVVYTTTQTHALGKKAALILGLQIRVLEVSSDDEFGLRGDNLRSSLEKDKQAGLKPFIFIATVGSTSSGAIDNLQEIGQTLDNYPNIWLHVDAAWAGVALSCPEYREPLRLADINEYATSFCTNFHKWGLVNFDCSGFWVRDRKLLTEALDVTPLYLRTKEGDAGTVIDYRNWQLPLGRRFRALKVWFVLRSYGVSGFQKHIRECIDKNKTFIGLVINSKYFKLVTEPSLALTVFRLLPGKESTQAQTTERLNELNQIFFDLISSRKDLMLTKTSLNGEVCIRFVVGSSRTTLDHVIRAYNILEEEANKALQLWAEPHEVAV